MIKYYKLFDLMNRKGMKKTELLDIMSAPTLAKLAKGETIKTDIIDRICIKLKCQPHDIMEAFEEITIINEKGENETYLKYIESDEEIEKRIKEAMETESYYKTRKEMESNNPA